MKLAALVLANDHCGGGTDCGGTGRSWDVEGEGGWGTGFLTAGSGGGKYSGPFKPQPASAAESMIDSMQ